MKNISNLYNSQRILILVLVLFIFLFAFTGALARCDDDQVCLDDPLGDATPQTLIGTVINTVLGVVGSIALLMFIYGGFTWMTAAGNEQRVAKGKEILVWATVGLMVIFSSYALVKFVFTGLGAK